MKSAIYLDHAAATPLDPRVFEAMRPHLETEYANPSSLYASARITRKAIEDARLTISSIMGAKPTEVVFTSGGTEGANMAIQGVLRAHPGSGWVTTAIEHDAVLRVPGATIVQVKPNGIVDASSIATALTDSTVLISVMMANNEIGTIQPIAEIAKLVAEIRVDRTGRGIDLPLYLHTDATQAAGYLDLHVTRLGVDLLSFSGSKIYGPKGTGALYVRQGTQLAPLMYGGGQERGRRSGTENVPGAVGLAKALSLAHTGRDVEARRLTGLRADLTRRLNTAIPHLILNGDPTRRLPNNVNLTLPGAEGEGLVLYLDQAGIMASTGSACTTGSLDPSHVLLAIGRTAAEADSSLRLTLGRSSSPADIDAVVAALPPIVYRLRKMLN